MSKIHPISVTVLEKCGRLLHRPECVLATLTGNVYVPEWPDAVEQRAGITVIRADGSQETWRASADFDLRPNGIALTPQGDFLVANLGDDGGVWRLAIDGTLTPAVTDIDGVPLPPANFVTVDGQGRAWMSFSTRLRPRQRAWRHDIADGFIVVLDDRGARIVADGLHYTNEVRPDPSGRWLYVVETFGRRIRRFSIAADAELSAPETVVTMGRGCFPDGFAFDVEGGIWITSLVSNRLMRFHDDRLETILEDINVAFVDNAEQAYAAGEMHAGHLGPIPGTRLQQLTSVAFGGTDRRNVYLGSLHSPCVYRFRSEIAGAAMEYWAFPAP
jgi:sugar lactone lactonase YvrE